jgi:hypothetical protein
MANDRSSLLPFCTVNSLETAVGAAAKCVPPCLVSYGVRRVPVCVDRRPRIPRERQPEGVTSTRAHRRSEVRAHGQQFGARPPISSLRELAGTGSRTPSKLKLIGAQCSTQRQASVAFS